MSHFLGLEFSGGFGNASLNSSFMGQYLMPRNLIFSPGSRSSSGISSIISLLLLTNSRSFIFAVAKSFVASRQFCFPSEIEEAVRSKLST
ncbi:unnamed protein product [Meloidogyne enterolobii]|uniref:Uncharacterized protein n=1 Tax=Meloidogyne enterolobii TaxID=390850 RepID=A0ACB0XRZ7_MELEN